MSPEAIAARESREYQNLKVMAGEIDHACRVAGVGSTAHSAEAEYPPRNWSGESNRSVFLLSLSLSLRFISYTSTCHLLRKLKGHDEWSSA